MIPPDLARLFDRTVVEALAKHEGQETDPDASRLRNYWTQGEGALVIEWDVPGALDRCEQLLDGYPINPQSLCRSYFQDVHNHSRYHEDEIKPREDAEAEGSDEDAVTDDDAVTDEDDTLDPEVVDDEQDGDDEPDTRSRRQRERDARRGRTRTGRPKGVVPDRVALPDGGGGRGDDDHGSDRGGAVGGTGVAMRHKGIDVGKVKAGPSDNLAEGEFIAYASVFGNRDSYGDVVQPGAFATSIEAWRKSGNTLPILYGHDAKNPHMNVGGVVSMVEDDRGLKIHGRLDLDTDTGRQVYRLVKGRRLSQLSFAYDEIRVRPVKGDPRLGSYKSLDELHVHEVSLVPVGANRETAVLAVKAAATGPSVAAWDAYFTASKFAPVEAPA